MSLKICILYQGGLRVTDSARNSFMACLFGCLKSNFASTSYALCSKGLGAYVSRDFPALLPPGWQSLQ